MPGTFCRFKKASYFRRFPKEISKDYLKEENTGINDTYTLEFLGLPEKERYSEEDLEQKIIDNLQKFL